MVVPNIETARNNGTAVAANGDSFERDTLTWTFAKLAESILDDLFHQAAERTRYSNWLAGEAPLLIERAGAEQGLLLVDLQLGPDGELRLIARPREGEFVLTVSHERFSVVLASAYAALAPQPEQECICVAHFEGDATLAAHWASGLRRALERRRERPNANGYSAETRLH